MGSAPSLETTPTLATEAKPVVFYGYSNFYGPATAIANGSYATMAGLGIPDNSISALRIGPWTKVTLYTDANYAGKSIVLTGPQDIPSLATLTPNLDYQASSVKVERVNPSIAQQIDCCSGKSLPSACVGYTSGTPACSSAYATFCATNMKDPRCQAWARANTEVADSIAAAYCKQNPNDPFCACIMSAANVNGVINPKCADQKCLASGYLTTTMKNSNCPDVINCTVQAALKNTGVSLASVPIQQNCGSTGNTGSTTSTPPVNALDIAGTGMSESSIIMIFVFIAIIFSIIMTVWWVSSRKGDRPEKSGEGEMPAWEPSGILV
jgi:hypothetical protein